MSLDFLSILCRRFIILADTIDYNSSGLKWVSYFTKSVFLFGSFFVVVLFSFFFVSLARVDVCLFV